MTSLTKAHKQKLRETQLRNISELPDRECILCKKIYNPTAFHQRFCCDTCRYNYMLIKEAKNKRPKYTCQFCNKTTQLNFSPIDNINKLKNFKCSHCGKKRK